MTDMQELPATEQKPVKGGRLKAPDEFRERLKGQRFIITSAQNNTLLHDKFWKTLKRMAKRTKSKLVVGRFTYNKNGWQKITADSENVTWEEELHPFFVDEQVKLADDLIFCGELDILPTNVYPLNGLDNYAGVNSAIIPHAKMQMRSLATMKHEDAKFLYTTGTVTQHNYIQRRAGQIAEYHHVYGAMVVEVSDSGEWFTRQLNADDHGIVYDLDRVWGPTWDKPISEFGRPYVNLGDIHIEKSDEVQMSTALSMLVKLAPEKVFIHDLLDMRSRNHHNTSDPHFLVGHLGHTVEADVQKAALWLQSMTQAFPDTEFIVIRSNHDEALGKWVREGTKFMDPINLRYWHLLNYMQLYQIEQGVPFDIFAYALFNAGLKPNNPNVRFVQEDESVLLRGIEFGMHGHLGPNGARGNPKSYRQIGRRANIGHTHSAGILDGVWTAGVLGSLDMGYNKGPSSWSCSHILTYPNGKRAIITQRGKQWMVGS